MQSNDSNKENYEVILVLGINSRDQKHIFIYRFPLGEDKKEEQEEQEEQE